jgi:hypothetical protein
MQTAYLAGSLAALSIILSPAPYALAQDAHVARGAVTKIDGTTLTVKVGDHEMLFAIDSKTSIEAPGAGTKQRAAEAAGKPGPMLADVVKVGQPVAVTYYDTNGALQASKVRAISTVPSGPSSGSAPGEPHSLTSNGQVAAVAERSITISGNGGGGATFRQTFTIDDRTRVFAKGAGTATRAHGGKVPFTTLVGNGDHVSVSYEKVGGLLYASDIRVTMKGH